MEKNLDSKLLEEIQKQFEKIKSEAGVEPDDETQTNLDELFNLSFDEMTEEMTNFLKTKKIKVKRLHRDAVLPKYNYGSDSGFDLYSVEEMTIPPFGRALVPTGISVQFDENLEVQVRPKSGLALNMGLTVLNTPGTVDQGYTGEIKVIVFNTNNNSVMIEKGMKIAQGVLCPVMNGKYVEIEDVDNIEDSDRGDNGFGSTGIGL
jgi:dUTP pyrophosphatase